MPGGAEPGLSAQSAATGGHGSALQRVEHIASTLRDLEARRIELASRFSGPVSSTPYTLPLPRDGGSGSVGAGVSKPVLTTPHVSDRGSESELLDDIARALETEKGYPK
jgi:hypothetical protein